jgi:hypothetical protein
MAQQATGQLAQRYADDFTKAVEWERQNALLKNQVADAMAQAYTDVYKTDMGTATNLLQQELQGTKYSADDLNAYLNAMYGAYAADTAWTNEQIRNRPIERWQQRQRYQQQRAWDKERTKQDRINTLLGSWSQLPQGRDWFPWTQGQQKLLQYLTTGAFPFASPQRGGGGTHRVSSGMWSPGAYEHWLGQFEEDAQALANFYGVR